jgi:excisionase family DNA binding protein
VSRLLRAAEVAEILGTNPRQPLIMAKDGRLPVVRLSRRAVRFRPEDVERLIQEHLIESPPRRGGGQVIAAEAHEGCGH